MDGYGWIVGLSDRSGGWGVPAAVGCGLALLRCRLWRLSGAKSGPDEARLDPSGTPQISRHDTTNSLSYLGAHECRVTQVAGNASTQTLPAAEAPVFNIVVVGADDSPTAAQAVRKAIALVKLTDGQLHIVTAYRPQRFTSSATEVDKYLKSLGSDVLAQSLLGELTALARAAGIRAETHALTGAPADAICQVADQIGADLIVVGNKGMQGIRRVLGSVPSSVAHQAPCDVLIAFTT